MRTTLLVRFDLVLDEPGAVSSPLEPAPEGQPRHPHSVPVTDRDGAPSLPATSVAGGLRALLEPHHPGLLGWVAEQQAAPSALRVLGTRLQQQPAALVDAQSTAVDRHRAAARTQTLRWDQSLPAGTAFEVFLRWDDPDPQQAEDVLQRLAGWRPYLGRAVSRGQGAAHVDGLRSGTLDLTIPAGLSAWLLRDGPDLVTAVATQPVAPPDAHPAPEQISVPLRIVDTLHIGSPTAGQGGEPRDGRGNLLTPLTRGGRHVVPASSLKGVLRSRSELILRSLGLPACQDAGCGSCQPCQLFGFGGGDPASGSVGQRAVFRMPDAVVTNAVLGRRTHVALDRVTGGARPGALVTFEVLTAGRFTVNVTRLGGSDQDWELLQALVVLVTQDLHDGYLGLGRGSSRGNGTVALLAPWDERRLAEARQRLRALQQAQGAA